jgi:FkbM family methyltransferase
MFQFKNMWLPDGEKHFPAWIEKHGEIVDGRCTYQLKKWKACLPWIRESRATAVDVGAHVGFWTIRMLAAQFKTIHAFEPMYVFRECLEKNIYGLVDLPGQRVYRHTFALGSEPGFVSMKYDPADSGGTHVSGSGDIEMRTLDSFNLQNVDFLKIDCEGAELDVVRGSQETIDRCKPCIIVEQKQHKLLQNYGTKGTPAVDLLKEMGAVVRREIGGDYILSF